MRRITYYANSNQSGNLLHIETDGCIVNIRVGLHKDDGRQATVVEILPDTYKGAEWELDVGALNTRIVEVAK